MWRLDLKLSAAFFCGASQPNASPLRSQLLTRRLQKNSLRNSISPGRTGSAQPGIEKINMTILSRLRPGFVSDVAARSNTPTSEKLFV
jgi:hypothetical protein